MGAHFCFCGIHAFHGFRLLAFGDAFLRCIAFLLCFGLHDLSVLVERETIAVSVRRADIGDSLKVIETRRQRELPAEDNALQPVGLFLRTEADDEVSVPLCIEAVIDRGDGAAAARIICEGAASKRMRAVPGGEIKVIVPGYQGIIHADDAAETVRIAAVPDDAFRAVRVLLHLILS